MHTSLAACLIAVSGIASAQEQKPAAADEVIESVTAQVLSEGWIVDDDLPPLGLAAWDRRKDGRVDLRLSLSDYPVGEVGKDLAKGMIRVMPGASLKGEPELVEGFLYEELSFTVAQPKDRLSYFSLRFLEAKGKMGRLTFISTIPIRVEDPTPEKAEAFVAEKLGRMQAALDASMNALARPLLEKGDEGLVLELPEHLVTLAAPKKWEEGQTACRLASWSRKEATASWTLRSAATTSAEELPALWVKQYAEPSEIAKVALKGDRHAFGFSSGPEEKRVVHRVLFETLGPCHLVLEITAPASSKMKDSAWRRQLQEWSKGWKVAPRKKD